MVAMLPLMLSMVIHHGCYVTTDAIALPHGCYVTTDAVCSRLLCNRRSSVVIPRGCYVTTDAVYSWLLGYRCCGVIVIPHGSTQLLISHAAVVLPPPPQLGHGLRLEEAEDPLGPVLPLDESRVPLRVQ